MKRNLAAGFIANIFAITLLVSSSAGASETETPLYRCVDKKDGYRLTIDAIYPHQGSAYVYRMKVISRRGDLIYTSNAEVSPIGRETIFAIYGGADDSNGIGTTSGLYFRVNKIGSDFEYILQEQSYAEIRLPHTIFFNCQ